MQPYGIVSLYPGEGGRLLSGVQKRLTIPAPAAETEWVFTVPGGTALRMLCGHVPFTAAANRNPGYTIQDPDGNVLWRLMSQMSVGTAADSCANYAIATNGINNSGADAFVAIPDVILPVGFKIGSYTRSLAGSGGQFGIGQFLIEEIDIGTSGEDYGTHLRTLGDLLRSS